MAEPLAEESLYHAHGITALSVLESLMTFKEEDFKKAIACADRTLKLSEKLAKVSKGFYKVVYKVCFRNHLELDCVVHSIQIDTKIGQTKKYMLYLFVEKH